MPISHHSPDVESGGDGRLFTQVHIQYLTSLHDSGGSVRQMAWRAGGQRSSSTITAALARKRAYDTNHIMWPITIYVIVMSNQFV